MQTFSFAVSAQIREAVAHCVAWALPIDAAAGDFDAARRAFEQADERFGTTRADKACKTQHFAGARLEAQISHPIWYREAFYLQRDRRVGRHGNLVGKNIGQVAPDHQIRHLLPRKSRGFAACDLHLVLGSAPDAKPVRLRVTIDGLPPCASYGAYIAADGSGTVNSVRLYQLVRQTGPIRERAFAVEFLDPSVSAYAFTFG